MEKQYSESELINFLDYLVAKGLTNESTTRGRKAAAVKVLSALDGHEKIDLRQLDRESTFQRFINKFGKDFSPDSLTTYRSRFNTALDDFLRWSENPAGFKPNISAARAQRKVQESGEVKVLPKLKSIEKNSSDLGMSPPQERQTHFEFPIPIRVDVIVRVQHLPMDLTLEEAERIAGVIKALALPRQG